MNSLVKRAWRLLAGAVLAFSIQSGAQAGLVTGSWDPQFGSPLTGLSWQVRADWYVPDTCATQGDGLYTTASGPCTGTRLLAYFMRWFNTGAFGVNPNDFFQMDWGVGTSTAHYGRCATDFLDNPSVEPGCDSSQFNTLVGPLNVVTFVPGTETITASMVRIVAGQVAGFDTTESDTTNTNAWPTAAGFHDFTVRFTATATTSAAIFTCYDNGSTIPNGSTSCGPSGSQSANADLQQVLVTYSGDGLDKTGQVGSGLRLNSQGQVIPEPSALVLALIALGAIGASRRRSV